MQALSLPMGGGLRPPQPPRFFKLCKLASKHMNLETYMQALSIEFANGGGLRPPQPPRFLSRASLLQSI